SYSILYTHHHISPALQTDRRSSRTKRTQIDIASSRVHKTRQALNPTRRACQRIFFFRGGGGKGGELAMPCHAISCMHDRRRTLRAIPPPPCLVLFCLFSNGVGG